MVCKAMIQDEENDIKEWKKPRKTIDKSKWFIIIIKEMTLFDRYNRILTYKVHLMMIVIYYQVKTLRNIIY